MGPLCNRTEGPAPIQAAAPLGPCPRSAWKVMPMETTWRPLRIARLMAAWLTCSSWAAAPQLGQIRPVSTH